MLCARTLTPCLLQYLVYGQLWVTLTLDPSSAVGETAEYPDHMDCLADVQENEQGEVLDCFGIYPQALLVATDWAINPHAQGTCVCEGKGCVGEGVCAWEA